MKRLFCILLPLCLTISMRAGNNATWLVDNSADETASLVQNRHLVADMADAGCPSFPSPLYSSLTYNVGCTPWTLEFNGQMSGDVSNATYQWYRYPEGSSQSSAVPCTWEGGNTFDNFLPATDELDSRYIYFCKVTTPSCPSGVNSGQFTVVVGPGGDACSTFNGTTFTITRGGSYTSGQTITITASTNAFGGEHIYTWYHNGEALDFDDPRYTFEWDFNAPKLIISNCTAADGGTYSISMQDGTECFMYTDPVRILVDNPSCGPDPRLSVAKSAICEEESTTTTVTDNTIAAGETGSLVYMLQPEGSHPSTTQGAWSTDMPGLYQFKYVVNNPDNPSCYRESKVVTVRVYENGGTLTITPDMDVVEYGKKVTFTVSPAPGADETGSVTFTNTAGASGTVYPNTYPNFAHTNYQQGSYTYTYTITNSKAGCQRTATCEVLWYHCGWGKARFGKWQNDHIKVGQTIDLGPSTPEAGLVGTFSYTLDGGEPVILEDLTAPFIPTEPGTYVFKYELDYGDPRVTDCHSETTKTITVDPCGTKATLSSNKTTLKVGESARLTYNNPASGETRALTYTKDGGAVQSLANTASPYTFAPTEPGTYVITYTITPSNCQATSQSVTINVYECGAEAEITADHSLVQPGTPVQLTLSAPGTDESATLTVSRNGATAQAVTGNTYTPTAEGTYTFTYTITHAYINCTRSAQTTVSVRNCSADITLGLSASTIALGESTTITPSRQPDADETASFTIQKDGQTVTDHFASTFTPAATGTYTITYTLTNAALGCETSDSKTLHVYQCGPEASVVSDHPYIQPNGTVYLTLSPLGDDETATLTYTLNGQQHAITATPSADHRVSFTPTEEGTYTITYSIAHPYINCTRSAQVTLRVLNCGAPAELEISKNIIPLGEDITLSLLRLPDDNETASVTYTLNGQQHEITSTQSSPVPLSNSPIPFTPTAVGSYTFTYTIVNTVLGCETSDSKILNVYQCGPEATIAPDRTLVQPNTPIQLTLSAPGTDETATLTYTLNGQQHGITYTPSADNVVSFTPTNAGTYTFTYTITHPYISCTRSAQTTVSVRNCPTAVTLTLSETAIALGRSVSITPSRQSEADETGMFTIQKDGQIVTDQIVSSFTPDATGSYTITYTLTNADLGCETTDSKTLNVYECGPDVTIDVDHTLVQPGTPIAFTLSAVGDNETATLSYMLNGQGHDVAITPSADQVVSFTPTTAGTYVFNYQITHAYIDCWRDAQAVVNVRNCAADIALTLSETAIALGGSVSITPSRQPEEDETVTFTIQKDGQNVTDQIVSSFTPDAIGRYTITYTLTNEALGCETTDSKTLDVYACGPEVAIEIPVSDLKLLRTTTIAVSELGDHETGSLTVAHDGGAPQAVSAGNWTAPELGTYTFTYTVTHAYINCTRSATATVQVIEAELVFDDNNGTHVWSDPKNWWPAYNRLPNLSDSAVIRRPCNVDIATAQTLDLTIDMTAGNALTIQPKGALTIAGHLLQCKQGDILVQADANSNGALVLGPENSNIPATVQFYARGKELGALYPTWQYMGYPLNDNPLISKAYPAAVFYEWTNIPNPKRGGNWQRVDSLAGAMQPFTGYCMTQTQEQTYTLAGTLNDPVRTTLPVPYNDQGTYSGFAFMANSWPAPIDIASLTTADFGAADATVYIMNSGTYEEAIQQQASMATGMGTARGQYNTIPIHAAPYLSGALTVIPPMQGFFLHCKTPTELVLDYTRTVFEPSVNRLATGGVSVTPTRAPRHWVNRMSDSESVAVYRFHVSGFGSEDQIHILTSPAFTRQFDNGWDGRKALSPNSDISLAVLSPDGPLSVAAVPETAGTELTFNGGNHKTYTLVIQAAGDAEQASRQYLHDLTADTYTPLTQGATYTFKCGAEPQRFIIEQLPGNNGASQPGDSSDEEGGVTHIEAQKFVHRGLFYIRLKTDTTTRLYDGTGRLLNTK